MKRFTYLALVFVLLLSVQCKRESGLQRLMRSEVALIYDEPNGYEFIGMEIDSAFAVPRNSEAVIWAVVDMESVCDRLIEDVYPEYEAVESYQLVSRVVSDLRDYATSGLPDSLDVERREELEELLGQMLRAMKAFREAQALCDGRYIGSLIRHRFYIEPLDEGRREETQVAIVPRGWLVEEGKSCLRLNLISDVYDSAVGAIDALDRVIPAREEVDRLIEQIGGRVQQVALESVHEHDHDGVAGC